MNRAAAVKATLSVAAYAVLMAAFWWLLSTYPDQTMYVCSWLPVVALAGWAWSVFYRMFKEQE